MDRRYRPRKVDHRPGSNAQRTFEAAFSPRQHAIGMILLIVVSLGLIVASGALLFRTLDPSGVYVFDYEISPTGEKERGKQTELHLYRNGTVEVVYKTPGGETQTFSGTWDHSGRTVRIYMGYYKNGTGIFEWSGKTLIGKSEDGLVTCYRRE